MVQEALSGALTVSEAAAALGVHPSTVYGLCDRQELAHFRVSNAIRVWPEDLQSFTTRRRRR